MAGTIQVTFLFRVRIVFRPCNPVDVLQSISPTWPALLVKHSGFRPDIDKSGRPRRNETMIVT